MFGGDILVAPIVYKDAYERAVYLPTGVKWTDANSGEVYDGGQEITVSAPIDVIPIFLREGSRVSLM
jgi:alpha-D-xyloside xylohydrolase